MQITVRAFPVLPGREDQVRVMAREMQGRRGADANAFYRRHGVARETWHTQQTPTGQWVIAVTVFEPQRVPEDAGREYAASEEPFDRWFKDQVKAITGVDPDTTPLGPETECVLDSVNCRAVRG